MDTNSQSSVWKHVTIDCKQLPCEIHNKRMDLVCEKVQKRCNKRLKVFRDTKQLLEEAPNRPGHRLRVGKTPIKGEQTLHSFPRKREESRTTINPHICLGKIQNKLTVGSRFGES